MAITSGADLSIIEGRLTAARAGYIDNLSAGAAALQATAAAIPVSPIKQIQKINTAFSSGTSAADTSITTVVIAKCVMVSGAQYANRTVPLELDHAASQYIQTTTNVRTDCYVAQPSDLYVLSWVVEYN